MEGVKIWFWLRVYVLRAKMLEFVFSVYGLGVKVKGERFSVI
jgi:hypothetical protein